MMYMFRIMAYLAGDASVAQKAIFWTYCGNAAAFILFPLVLSMVAFMFASLIDSDRGAEHSSRS